MYTFKPTPTDLASMPFESRISVFADLTKHEVADIKTFKPGNEVGDRDVKLTIFSCIVFKPFFFILNLVVKLNFDIILESEL